MLDCGLNMQSILHFMPMPMVPSSRFNSLPTWIPRDNQQDWQIEGVSSRFFILITAKYKDCHKNLVLIFLELHVLFVDLFSGVKGML